MNERIKELEKQAWEFVDKTWDWTNPDNPNKATLFKTKFAELIVAECANIAASEPFNAGAASAYIKEHFGVEE